MSSFMHSGARLPTHLDLPSSDDLPADDMYHPAQWDLLMDSVRDHLNKLHLDENYLIARNLGIYFRITMRRPKYAAH